MNIIFENWKQGRAETRRWIARCGSANLGGDGQGQPGEFAGACYDMNSLSEMDLSAVLTADETDCEAWELTPAQWAFAIGRAYEARLNDDA